MWQDIMGSGWEMPSSGLMVALFFYGLIYLNLP
jgi:hypothetical protein